MKGKLFKKTPCKVTLILLCTLLCTSCATSVGLTAAAVTSATISVGTAVVKAPFKLIGMSSDDEDEDEKID
jgi:hypothetical protein